MCGPGAAVGATLLPFLRFTTGWQQSSDVPADAADGALDSAGSRLALFRFIFSSDKHRHASIASESLILILMESVARADCDLLDVDLLGQEEPEDTGGSAVPGCPPRMAHVMSFSSLTPFPGVPPHNTHGRWAPRSRVRQTR